MAPIKQLLLLALVVALASQQLISNTISNAEISDIGRYYERLSSFKENRAGLYLFYPLTFLGKEAFQLSITFIFLFFLSWLSYEKTNSWFKTAFILIGFSASFAIYFFLFAQMFVFLIALFIWWRKNSNNDMLVHMLAIIASFLFHPLGGILVLMFIFLKGFETNSLLVNKALAVVVILCALYILSTYQRTDKVDFFFHFLLPFNMGWLDYLFWFLWIILLSWVAFKAQHTREKCLASALFLSAVLVSLASGNVIDFWRIIMIIEPISIAEASNHKQLQIGMFLLSLQRLVIGLII